MRCAHLSCVPWISELVRDRGYLPLRRVRGGRPEGFRPEAGRKAQRRESSRELRDVKSRSAESEFGRETRGVNKVDIRTEETVQRSSTSYIRVSERARDLRTEEKSEGIIEISVPAERRSAVATEGERRLDQLHTEGETDYGKISRRAGNAESKGIT